MSTVAQVLFWAGCFFTVIFGIGTGVAGFKEGSEKEYRFSAVDAATVMIAIMLYLAAAVAKFLSM
jgi:hypothetical protein